MPNGPGHDFCCMEPFLRRCRSIVAQVEMGDDTLLNSSLEYALEPGEMGKEESIGKGQWMGWLRIA